MFLIEVSPIGVVSVITAVGYLLWSGTDAVAR